MTSTNLTVLLDLRRAAEEGAKRVLAEAVAALAHAQEEQTKLESLVAETEQKLAAQTCGSPADAAEGLARERFRQRLLARREQAKAKARQHREGALAQARRAETAAAESLRHASLERQAAERLRERQQAEQRKQAERREEQRAEDWLHASRHQKRG